jgi:spermidine/putrescine-binding protein
VAAENIAFLKYLSPNKEAYALLGEDLRKNPGVFMDPKLRAKSEIIADLGESLALYIRVWDDIKAAK